MVIAEQGRVAPGDDVDQILAAQAVAVLSAEHPGLSAADSLGIYLTWQPRRGRTDAELDCISNVWPDGLSPAAAVDKLLWLISEMRRLRLTGVGVKDAQHGAFAGADTPLHLARWARGEGAVHPLARPPHAGSADPEPCPRAPGG